MHPTAVASRALREPRLVPKFQLNRYGRRRNCFANHDPQMIGYSLQPICKTFFCNSESESEVIWHSETIARCKERPTFSDSATELSRIAAALQPWKRNHPAPR